MVFLCKLIEELGGARNVKFGTQVNNNEIIKGLFVIENHWFKREPINYQAFIMRFTRFYFT